MQLLALRGLNRNLYINQSNINDKTNNETGKRRTKKRRQLIYKKTGRGEKRNNIRKILMIPKTIYVFLKKTEKEFLKFFLDKKKRGCR